MRCLRTGFGEHSSGQGVEPPGVLEMPELQAVLLKSGLSHNADRYTEMEPSKCVFLFIYAEAGEGKF